jgi:putative ABC transport system permease protein
VPKEEFIQTRADEFDIIAGSIEDWNRRTDAALVGRLLADRRNLSPGMTFDAAGITAYVAGIIDSDDPQYINAAYTALEFVQLAGRDQLGIVTQFNVEVTNAGMLDTVSEQIDDLFRTAQEPTATFTETAFVSRIADDIVELVGFARWLAIGCLVAVLALVANAIVLSVQSRVAEHAVLQTLGFKGSLVAWLIIAEGVLIAVIGGLIGAAGAIAVTEFSSFALSVEGQSIPIAADLTLLASGLLVCASIGVLAGLVPAAQASRREIAACFRMV